jgi:transcriptional regulator with XRE-family HTH domain
LKETPKEVKIYVDLYADLVVRINQILKEKGISKKELAEMLDKQPSEISKWLGGDHNFTLKSISKLSAELNENLLMVTPSNRHFSFVEVEDIRSVQTFVVYQHHQKQTKGRETKLVKFQEAIKELTNVG